MATLPSVVQWLEDPGPGTVSFLHERGDDGRLSWQRLDQPSLRDRVVRAASVLADRGVRSGRNVVVVLDTCPELVAGFFGALALGAVPTVMAVPGLGDRKQHAAWLATVLRTLQPATIVCEDRLSELARRVANGDGLEPDRTGVAVVRRSQLGEGDPDRSLPFGGAQAIRQLTSGTTAHAKAVLLTTDAVSRHLASITQWLHLDQRDVGVSWLPLHHDMGLIGHLLLPLSLGADEWLLPPRAFLRDPAAWLRCISDHGGTITAAPTFAYHYVMTKTDGADLGALDLRGLKAAIVGAERVDPETLARFARHCAPAGLRPTALTPAYGLAEATLAVSGKRLGAEVVAGGQGLVSCGPPLPGVRVEIVDDQGQPLPEGGLGEIVVHSASIGRIGPIGREAAEPPAPLRTGDAGFLLDGELFVVGRLGDSLSIRGRRVFAESVEAAIASEVGVSNVVAMGDELQGPLVLVFVEDRCPPTVAARIRAVARREADLDARCAVVAVRRGAVPRSSSGKPRRRALWDAHAAGRFEGAAVPVDELEPIE